MSDLNDQSSINPSPFDDENVESKENQAFIEQFRQKLDPKVSEKYTNHQLFKFLLARSRNVDKALIMFQSTLEWRKKLNVDELPYETCPIVNHVRFPLKLIEQSQNENAAVVEKRGFPLKDHDFDLYAPFVPEGWVDIVEHVGGGCYHKADKAGFPIYIDKMGNVNAKKMAACDQSKLLEYHLCNLEFLIKKLMPEYSRLAGKVIDRHTVIMDLTGIGFSHLNIKSLNALKGLANVDQDYYPELIHRVFFINAPSLFAKLWSIIRIWLDKRTQAKVHIMGSDYQNTLLQYIDENDLPSIYGGKCTCSHISTGCVP